MEAIFQNFNELAGIVSGSVNVLSNFATDCWHAIPIHESALSILQASNRICGIVPAADPGILATGGSVVSIAFAAAITYSDIPEETLSIMRRWHGSIDDQFSNIDNLVTLIQSHSAWSSPPSFSEIVTNRTTLATLIQKCRSGSGSSNDRGQRSYLLKYTIGLCLTNVKLWAYTQYNSTSVNFTLYDLHSLGFLLPSEMGGRHSRSTPTDVVAEVKVTILSADVIKAVVDQASEDNAALTVHGWPTGVKMALIVILSADGQTEVYRQHTTRLHTEIKMPDGSHGKQFIIKAAFLKHVDDVPKFGPQPTFTMPYSTEDLNRILDHQHHEEFESHIREIENLRRQLEQLQSSVGKQSGS
jgi:hypothetical protein